MAEDLKTDRRIVASLRAYLRAVGGWGVGMLGGSVVSILMLALNQIGVSILPNWALYTFAVVGLLVGPFLAYHRLLISIPAKADARVREIIAQRQTAAVAPLSDTEQKTLKALRSYARTIKIHLDGYSAVEATRSAAVWAPWMETAGKLTAEVRTPVEAPGFPAEARYRFSTPIGKTSREQTVGPPICRTQRDLAKTEVGLEEAIAVFATEAGPPPDDIDRRVALLQARQILVPGLGVQVDYSYFDALLTASSVLIEGARAGEILEAIAQKDGYKPIRNAVSEALPSLLQEWQLVSFVALADRRAPAVRGVSVSGSSSEFYRLTEDGKEVVRRSKARGIARAKKMEKT